MKFGKLIVGSSVAFILGISLVFGGAAAPRGVQSASASKLAANDRAATMYAQKIRQLAKKADGDVNMKLRDLTGDGIDEAIFTYLPSPRMGSASKFEIYSYKNGKMKCFLNEGEYGYYKLVSYPKVKSFTAYKQGHGGEARITYQLKKGKFRAVVMKSRSMMVAHAKWGYYRYAQSGAKVHKVNKASYEKALEKLQKGKKRTVRFY